MERTEQQHLYDRQPADQQQLRQLQDPHDQQPALEQGDEHPRRHHGYPRAGPSNEQHRYRLFRSGSGRQRSQAPAQKRSGRGLRRRPIFLPSGGQRRQQADHFDRGNTRRQRGELLLPAHASQRRRWTFGLEHQQRQPRSGSDTVRRGHSLRNTDDHRHLHVHGARDRQ